MLTRCETTKVSLEGSGTRNVEEKAPWKDEREGMSELEWS